MISAFVVDKIVQCIERRRNGIDEAQAMKDIRMLFKIEDFNTLVASYKEEAKKHNKVTEESKNPGIQEEDKEQEHLTLHPDVVEKRRLLEEYLKRTFNVDDVREIDPTEIKKAFEPRSVVERVNYRQEVGNIVSGKKPFVIVKKDKPVEHKLASTLKQSDLNPYIGFQCLHYSILEGAGSIEILICNKTKDIIEVGVRTVDDTAKAPDDYHHKDEVLVFKKNEYK